MTDPSKQPPTRAGDVRRISVLGLVGSMSLDALTQVLRQHREALKLSARAGNVYRFCPETPGLLTGGLPDATAQRFIAT